MIEDKLPERWTSEKQVACCCAVWVAGPETARGFGQSCCWGNPIMWRLPILIWAVLTIIWSMMTFWGPLEKWPLYMTHWGLVIIVLESFFGILVAVGAMRGRLCESPCKLPVYVKIYWVLFNIAIPVAFLVTVFYWAVLRGMFSNTKVQTNSTTTTILYRNSPKPKTSKQIRRTNTKSHFVGVNTDYDLYVTKRGLLVNNVERGVKIQDIFFEIGERMNLTDEELETIEHYKTNLRDYDGDDDDDDFSPRTTTTAKTRSRSKKNNNTSNITPSMTYKPSLASTSTSTTTKAAAGAITSNKSIMTERYNPDPILDMFLHKMNSIVMLVELMFSNHPSRLLQVYQPFLFGVSYAMFGLVYYFAGGLDPWGNRYIYPVIDWTKPSETFVLLLLTGLYLALMHVLVVILAFGRDKVHIRFNPRSR